MKFLVIGCGSIGRRHIRNLKCMGIQDLLAYDVVPERRREAEDEFGVSSYSSLRDAFLEGPHAAVITTPTSWHIPVALQAAQQGCQLFIEKPLSHNLEGVDELSSLVQAQGLVTLVGCNMRFHPGIATIKKLLEDGAVGRVIAARVQVGQWLPDWHPWEDYRTGYSARRDLGGGIILDSVHELDYISWLVGSEVQQVSCFAGKLSRLEIDTEDTAAILLRFADGCIGEVHLDYVQRAYSRSCHIIGEEGTIRWDETEGRVCHYSASTESWHSYPDPPGWEVNEMYMDEMRHFLRCLAGEETPTLDLASARRVLEIALAAKQSSESNQVVQTGVAAL